MNSILLKFKTQLEGLRKLVQFYETENKLQADFIVYDPDQSKAYLYELSQHFKAFSVTKREFNYNSLVISLYGYFERFIEDIVVDYLDQLNKAVPNYNDLPEKITERHYSLCIALLGKLDQARYAGLAKKDIIDKLNKCLNVGEQYKFIIDAFTQHGANFKTSVIDDFFGNLDISAIGKLIMDNQIFKQFTQTRLGINPDDNINAEQSFEIINDLAQRRNDVAHGVSSGLLQNTIISEYITFFEEYSNALVNVCNNSLIKFTMVEEYEELGEIKEIHRYGQVVCLETNKVPLKKGDKLQSVGATRTINGSILGIQIDGKDVEEVDSNENYYVGLYLDIKASKSIKLNKLTLKEKA